MSRKRFIEGVVKQVKKNTRREYSFTEINEIFDAIIDELCKQLKDGNKVQIKYIGVFSRVYLQTRRYRDPNTGEWNTKIGRAIIRFKASEFLNRRIRVT